MRFSWKLGATALMATFLLASAVGTASAGRLSVSSQRFRVAWSRLEFQSEVATVRCPVTLEGSFHSATIAKIARLLIGAVTRVNIREASCQEGSASINNATLPWHVTYESFSGTLPNISAVNLLLSRFLFTVELIGVACTYGTSTDNITGAAAVAGGEITELRPVAGRNTAHRLSGSIFCPATGNLVSAAGDGRVTVLNSTTRIRVTLI